MRCTDGYITDVGVDFIIKCNENGTFGEIPACTGKSRVDILHAVVAVLPISTIGGIPLYPRTIVWIPLYICIYIGDIITLLSGIPLYPRAIIGDTIVS